MTFGEDKNRDLFAKHATEVWERNCRYGGGGIFLVINLSCITVVRLFFFCSSGLVSCVRHSASVVASTTLLFFFSNRLLRFGGSHLIC